MFQIINILLLYENKQTSLRENLNVLVKIQDCHFFLKYESAKDNLIKHKYLSCNKDCSRKIDEGLKKKIQGHM